MENVENNSVNHETVKIFNRLTKMSITQLKAVLKKVKLTGNEADRDMIRMIKSIIQKKKAEYPAIANGSIEQRFRSQAHKVLPSTTKELPTWVEGNGGIVPQIEKIAST